MRTPLDVDPEAALLFALACRTGDPVPNSRLKTGARWQRLVQLASNENALIVLRDRLGALVEADVLPPGIERSLALLALDREYRMRLLQTRLEQSLAALNAANIDVMLLKGAALACTTYGSFVARPMRDIDLLVRPAEAIAARTVLLELGWQSDPDIPEDSLYGAHQHLAPLRDASGRGLWLEIHRSLLASGHPFRFTEEEIWESALPVTVGTGNARVMHPAHHGAYLAIHFAWSHKLKTGAWHTFRDLDALTTAGTLDWEMLVNTARDWGASSCCYWTLELAGHLSGLRVPEAVIDRVRPRMPDVMQRLLARHFLNSILQSDQACPSLRLDQLLWTMAMRPRREGHGAIRPWLLARELTSAFVAKENGEIPDSDPVLVRMARATQYLAGLVA